MNNLNDVNGQAEELRSGKEICLGDKRRHSTNGGPSFIRLRPSRKVFAVESIVDANCV